MTGIRVTIHRIDADPVDMPDGPAFDRLRQHLPEMDRAAWTRILSHLPADRLRTHVALNEKGWPSSSELLEALSECDAVSDLLDILPQDGWLDRGESWKDAEIADQARDDAGGSTILTWRRPLVRLGTLISVSGDSLPQDMSARLETEFGDAMVLQADRHAVTVVVVGSPQDVEARVNAALPEANDGPDGLPHGHDGN